MIFPQVKKRSSVSELSACVDFIYSFGMVKKIKNFLNIQGYIILPKVKFY